MTASEICLCIRKCLTSTYFQYNGKHYRLQGTAMGSPVSVVVAEIVMQNIEEQALATYTRTVPLWLRYVDDTFTAVHKDGIDDFHEHLNRQNADIQFTKEIEENGKIPFLDCLVTRENIERYVLRILAFLTSSLVRNSEKARLPRLETRLIHGFCRQHTIESIPLTSSKYSKCHLVMKNKPHDRSQKETVIYFE